MPPREARQLGASVGPADPYLDRLAVHIGRINLPASGLPLQGPCQPSESRSSGVTSSAPAPSSRPESSSERSEGRSGG